MNRVTILIAILALLTLGLNAQNDITFSVDMNIQAQAGNFDPGTQDVQISGSQNGWGAPSGDMLNDGDGDLIYSELFALDDSLSGTDIFYKYILYDGANVAWETIDNRSLSLTGSPQVLDVVFWDDVSEVLVDGTVKFQVSTETFNMLGLFTPASANDSMQVRGSFNGWSDGDPDNSKMSLAFGEDHLYEVNTSFAAVQGSTVWYKYFAKLDEGAHGAIDGWEEPLSQGGGNRFITFEGTTDEQETFDYYYMDIPPIGITPGTITLSMSIDMQPAADDPGSPFDPAVHNVYLGLYDQFFANMNDWRSVGPQEDLTYSDDDGDMVYTLTWDVAPSYYGVLYRVSYGETADGIVGEEGGGFGAGNKRARYIRHDGSGNYPDTFEFPMDVFTFGKPLDIESHPDWPAVGIDEEDELIPVSFGLEQNYPNPFNPTTTIAYNVDGRANVHIDIYNVMGQKVKTLVRTTAIAGTHTVTWDATNDRGQAVGSGVYIYKMTIDNDRVDSKKMLLVR